MPGQGRAKRTGPVDGRAVDEPAGRIDGRPGVAVHVPPLTDPVEVLEGEAQRIDDGMAGAARRVLPVGLQPLPDRQGLLTPLDSSLPETIF